MEKLGGRHTAKAANKVCKEHIPVEHSEGRGQQREVQCHAERVAAGHAKADAERGVALQREAVYQARRCNDLKCHASLGDCNN